MKNEMTAMKKMAKRMATLMVAGLCIVATLTGCGAKKVTLTFMNGDTTLGTEEVEAGKVVDAAIVDKYATSEDYNLEGWFETPTFIEASAVDFATATFEEDTTIFGDFASNAVAEDTRKWYIVGEGKGIVGKTQWAGGVDDDVKAAAELTLTGEATNEFQITVDLNEGDLFQIIHDWAWDGQKGYGCFTEIDESQMASGGSLGGSESTANVKVLVSGNYTITLTTDPDNAKQDTLTIVRNGDIQ